jgi:hypothetical protein
VTDSYRIFLAAHWPLIISLHDGLQDCLISHAQPLEDIVVEPAGSASPYNWNLVAVFTGGIKHIIQGFQTEITARSFQTFLRKEQGLTDKPDYQRKLAQALGRV